MHLLWKLISKKKDNMSQSPGSIPSKDLGRLCTRHSLAFADPPLVRVPSISNIQTAVAFPRRDCFETISVILERSIQADSAQKSEHAPTNKNKRIARLILKMADGQTGYTFGKIRRSAAF